VHKHASEHLYSKIQLFEYYDRLERARIDADDSPTSFNLAFRNLLLELRYGYQFCFVSKKETEQAVPNPTFDPINILVSKHLLRYSSICRLPLQVEVTGLYCNAGAGIRIGTMIYHGS